MDPQRGRNKQADPRQHGVQEIQQRCQEHEQEFQRLGDPGQERGDGHGEQHAANHRTTRFRRSEVHRQRRARQTKHHDREEAGHEHACGAVTRVEAVDIAMEDGACGIGKFANLEPGDGVQHLMQAGRDQQTVNEAEDAGANRAHGDDPLPARVNSVLYRRPDIAKNRRQDQAEEAGGNRHKAFAAEEAQELRQLDVGPAVVDRAAHQTGDDTGEHAHVDGRVDGDHRFGHHKVAYRTCQRRCACAVFRPRRGHTDSEDQGKVIKNCPARLGDKRDVKQIGLAESQQQRRDGQYSDRKL